MNITMISSWQLIGVITMGACIGGIAGYLGSLMVTKRMALMAGALGHLTLPGVSLGLLYGFDVSIGALIFLTLGIFVIWLLQQWTKLPLEALTAVVFASSLAVAFLFLQLQNSQNDRIKSQDENIERLEKEIEDYKSEIREYKEDIDKVKEELMKCIELNN